MAKTAKKTIAEVYQDAGGGYRFRLKAQNGRIISSSESYTRKSDAARGAARAYPFAVVVKK